VGTLERVWVLEQVWVLVRATEHWAPKSGRALVLILVLVREQVLVPRLYLPDSFEMNPVGKVESDSVLELERVELERTLELG